MDKYDPLKLENQLCFPLYAASKEVVRKYKPFLDELDLTYTQYVVMMVLWEKEHVNVKDLGEAVFLDSGTLTPLLKSLERKKYVKRERSQLDERVLNVSLTEEGEKLKDRALSVPGRMAACVRLTKEEATTLYTILYKIIRE